MDLKNLDFKALTLRQEAALRRILANCAYLHGSVKYNLSEFVLREVTQQLAQDYDDLK